MYSAPKLAKALENCPPRGTSVWGNLSGHLTDEETEGHKGDAMAAPRCIPVGPAPNSELLGASASLFSTARISQVCPQSLLRGPVSAYVLWGRVSFVLVVGELG